MEKPLSEMTNEELLALFPVVLKPHNPQYKEQYENEKQRIMAKIDANDIIRINHIGSSAVKGLISKPIVDMLLEVDGCCKIAELMDDLASMGWNGMKVKHAPVTKFSCSKGYTQDGYADQVCVLHVRYYGNWSELYFRDYLIEYPDVANAYGAVKHQLMNEFENNKDGYTIAKTDFITKYSEIAKREYNNKYKPK